MIRAGRWIGRILAIALVVLAVLWLATVTRYQYLFWKGASGGGDDYTLTERLIRIDRLTGQCQTHTPSGWLSRGGRP